MLGTSVPVQNETFSLHAEAAEKQRRNDCGGVFHRSFSFVLPPTERYWYWHFSGSSTADESFTHSGSSDSHGAQSDGGKNKQLWFHQVFPPLWMAFLPLPSLSCFLFFASSFLKVLLYIPFPLVLLLFCALSPQNMVQQCHLWCVERHFILSHLPIWICVTMHVYM